MTQLLYIGNNLNKSQTNISAIGVLGPMLEHEGYTLYFASSKSNKVIRLLDMLYSVCRYAKRTDVVLIDTYSTQNFYYTLIVSQLCRFLKLPYMPILHGGNLPNRLTANPRMSSLIFDHARCNVAPSNYLKEQFETHGYTNLKYIPNTIVIDHYPFLKREYIAPKLLWVRSFSKIYNPLLAVKVLKTLEDRDANATLCMVGPDSDGTLEHVKVLAEKLGLNVKFTGKLTKVEWTQLSKDYNVFINTTTIDNTPISVIEAMALGLPVVSTNVGGMPYLIDDGINGILVEDDNEDDMAQAITMLFKDSEKRDQMILNARKSAEQFDWNNVKQLWNEVLLQK